MLKDRSKDQRSNGAPWRTFFRHPGGRSNGKVKCHVPRSEFTLSSGAPWWICNELVAPPYKLLSKFVGLIFLIVSNGVMGHVAPLADR